MLKRLIKDIHPDKFAFDPTAQSMNERSLAGVYIVCSPRLCRLVTALKHADVGFIVVQI